MSEFDYKQRPWSREISPEEWHKIFPPSIATATPTATEVPAQHGPVEVSAAADTPGSPASERHFVDRVIAIVERHK